MQQPTITNDPNEDHDDDLNLFTEKYTNFET
jgi:hypothetical protein